jgi:hypothetical protein
MIVEKQNSKRLYTEVAQSSLGFGGRGMRLYLIRRKLGRTSVIILLNLFVGLTAFAANDDVVVMKNGDRMTGELKSLQRGQLSFKADYMADSVVLDWTRIERLESKSTFLILLVNGKLFTSSLRLVPANSSETANFVIGSAKTAERVAQLDVIGILPAGASFFKRLDGSIDLGFSFTSGNKQYETGLAATATYRTGDHSFGASVESSFSGQVGETKTTRNQFTFEYRKALKPSVFAGAVVDFLKSDQQSLRLRSSVGGLIGRNLHQSERTRLSLYGGLVVNREHYSKLFDQPEKTNADALAGLDFSTFRFKTTDITSRLSLFPSMTTPGRMRLQTTSTLKIKIVKDLYWGLHVYENFDSKPPVRANKNDLGVSTSLGWKF